MITVLLSSSLIVLNSTGHRDGCRRSHRCPSDSGSYVCGDLEYDDECLGSNNNEDAKGDNSARNSANEDDKKGNYHSNVKNDNNNSDEEENQNVNSYPIDDTTPINKNSVSSNKCTGSANCFTGTISKVVDGDTVDVDGDIRIRLTLVNTPERGDQGYQEAKEFVNLACGVGTKVLVDEDDGQKAGSYGRMIGLVHCGEDKLLLNQMLVEKGYAQIFYKYCERSEFSQLNWAQVNGCKR